MLEDGIIKYEGHDQERVPKELKIFRSTYRKQIWNPHTEWKISPSSGTVQRRQERSCQDKGI